MNGTDHDCYVYEMDILNIPMGYFTERVFNPSDFPTTFPTQEGKACYGYGTVYFTAIYGEPPCVKLAKATLLEDGSINVYYYWGDAEDLSDYWVVTFKKKDDGGYLMSQTKYLGQNSGADDIEDTDDSDDTDGQGEVDEASKEWIQIYLDFLNGFDTIELDNGDRRVQNTDYAFELKDGNVDYVSAIFGKSHSNRMIFELHMNGDQIPETLFRDDGNSYIASYYDGKIRVSRFDSKNSYQFYTGGHLYFQTSETGYPMRVLANIKEGRLNAYCTGIVDSTGGETKYYFLEQDLGDYYENNISDIVMTEANRVSESDYNRLWNEKTKDLTPKSTESKYSLEVAINGIKGYED